METIKPCPFCDSSKSSPRLEVNWYKGMVWVGHVVCTACSTVRYGTQSKDESVTRNTAIAAWNQRPTDAVMEAAQKVLASIDSGITLCPGCNSVVALRIALLPRSAPVPTTEPCGMCGGTGIIDQHQTMTGDGFSLQCCPACSTSGQEK